jgi:hypothetical protein
MWTGIGPCLARPQVIHTLDNLLIKKHNFDVKERELSQKLVKMRWIGLDGVKKIKISPQFVLELGP